MPLAGSGCGFQAPLRGQSFLGLDLALTEEQGLLSAGQGREPSRLLAPLSLDLEDQPPESVSGPEFPSASSRSSPVMSPSVMSR